MSDEKKTARDRVITGMKELNEEAKKRCEGHIKKCTEITQKAKKKQTELDNPDSILSFEDMQKLNDALKDLRVEFKENMDLAFKELKKADYDRDYRKSVNSYFNKLNKIMQISEEKMFFIEA